MFLFIPFSVRVLTFGTIGSGVLFYLIFYWLRKISAKPAQQNDPGSKSSETPLYALTAVGVAIPLILVKFTANDPAAIYLLLSTFIGGLSLPIVLSRATFEIMKRSNLVPDNTRHHTPRSLYAVAVFMTVYVLGLSSMYFIGGRSSDYLVILGGILMTIVITVKAARKAPSTSAYDLIPEMAPRPTSASIADELDKLHALKEKGGLTANEYEQQKKKLLNS